MNIIKEDFQKDQKNPKCKPNQPTNKTPVKNAGHCFMHSMFRVICMFEILQV